MNPRRFAQVDVFSAEPFRGNPVAVVVDGEGISDHDMQAFARWTNLSETTFLLPPTTPEADYRVRIFTTDEELPFAGHPTLGSAHAWRAAGGTPRTPGRLVQECAAGLVELRERDGRWAFAGPPLTRYEPVDEATLARAVAGLRLDPADVLDSSWLVNGPVWIGLRLASAEQVLAIRPDFGRLGDLFVGVVGPYPEDDGAAGGDERPDLEVRALMGTGTEDPVTGSLNAGVARWLMDTGEAPAAYLAAQGTVLGRAGRVHVAAEDGEIWVGGDTATVVEGTVRI
ncbi:PhzF family phenazine biosynthesis protein [Georgenia thermotolerans]|uniref:PhzF family phenazine biosynthesis isomerase n=1 Tax=Georgenia thermotolerans TaxID=527326 RepID=A0A7J5UNA7_9MICO|nr:PhzF family phenazine biosynthesis protein [Georgenia thermotolerans]KAE8763878.1 PhzF family phenazine biosynthesis isomerase [Georgenia thermotolerans]